MTLRWDGEAWVPLGDPWLRGASMPEASTALWDGHAPITAWRDGDAIRVALYNGEVP
jgi:hypothetical protein